MAIIHQINKKTGTVYVYEQVSKWVPELHQPRAHRKLIGKLDATGKVVPTGPVGRPRKRTVTEGDADKVESSLSNPEVLKLLSSLQDSMKSIQSRLDSLETELSVLHSRIEKTGKILTGKEPSGK